MGMARFALRCALVLLMLAAFEATSRAAHTTAVEPTPTVLPPGCTLTSIGGSEPGGNDPGNTAERARDNDLSTFYRPNVYAGAPDYPAVLRLRCPFLFAGFRRYMTRTGTVSSGVRGGWERIRLRNAIGGGFEEAVTPANSTGWNPSLFLAPYWVGLPYGWSPWVCRGPLALSGLDYEFGRGDALHEVQIAPFLCPPSDALDDPPASAPDLQADIRHTSPDSWSTFSNYRIDWTTTVANLGTSTASGVIVRQHLPSASSFYPQRNPGWSCSVANGPVECNYSIGDIPLFQQREVTMNVDMDVTRLPDDASLWDAFSRVTVESASPDADPLNNSDVDVVRGPAAASGPGVIYDACAVNAFFCPIVAVVCNEEDGPPGPLSGALSTQTHQRRDDPVESNDSRPELADGSSLTPLAIYYRVRDELLAPTATGLRYVALYYKHAREIAQLIRSDETTARLAVTARRSWQPSLDAYFGGRAGNTSFSAVMATDMDALLERLRAVGSASLRADIERERVRVNFQSLVGQTVDRAAREITRSLRRRPVRQ